MRLLELLLGDPKVTGVLLLEGLCWLEKVKERVSIFRLLEGVGWLLVAKTILLSRFLNTFKTSEYCDNSSTFCFSFYHWNHLFLQVNLTLNTIYNN